MEQLPAHHINKTKQNIGPKGGQTHSQMDGQISHFMCLDQWRNQVGAEGAERPPGQQFWGNF